MKFFTLLLLLCMAMAASVSAQQFGVKGGMNGSSVFVDGESYNTFKASFYVGAFAEFELPNRFSVQPEIVYSAQGTYSEFIHDVSGMTKSVTVIRSELQTTSKVNYLNIPILVKYELFDGFTMNVGPQFGFLLGGLKQDWDLSYVAVTDGVLGSVSESGTDNYNKDDVNTFDFSVAVGLEYDITERIDVSVRYNIGLTDIAKDGKSRNGVFQLGVGFKIF